MNYAWLEIMRDDLKHLNHLDYIPRDSRHNLSLRRGQVWSKRSNINNKWQIIEIAGFHSNNRIAIYDWEITNMDNDKPNQISLRNAPTKILGTGSKTITSINT